MSITLGEYVPVPTITLAITSQKKKKENNITATRRQVIPTQATSVQTVPRAGATVPAHLPFATPIAGPAGSSIGTDTGNQLRR